MTPLARARRQARPAFAVYAIAAATIAVFYAQLGDGPTAAGWGVVPYDLTHGIQPRDASVPPIATLLTSPFVHASVLHVVSNMLVLIAMGPAVEFEFGTPRFVALYAMSAVAGSLAQVASDPASHVPEVGASGAIAGVLGAFLFRFPTAAIVGIPAFVVIGLWAAVQFAHGLAAPGVPETAVGGTIAYFSHMGGFVAGIVLAALWSRAPRASTRTSRAR